ncbi:MAG TPA: organic hydroperoxide resistance protein [Candidatus Acidoferrum sp.]|jgi:osmotically inducible protein OsmC|nr:organic hydroperoxide resistance protein [Candidatus Acidoferrum sp.]
MSATMTEQSNIPQVKKVVYTAKVHTTGGRDGGTSRSSDGRLDVKLSIPGGPGTGTNPEQLFAAGWSNCFTSALKIVSAKRKVKFPEGAFVDTEVDLCVDENDRHFLRARFNISLPGLDQETAQAIVDTADQLCPYSRVTRGNIDVEMKLV